MIAGGADTQLALLGTGNIRRGDWALVGGTFWQTAVIWDQPLIDPKFRPRTLCHVTPDRWMTEGIAFLVGQQARVQGWTLQGGSSPGRTAGYRSLLPDGKVGRAGAPGADGVIGLFSAVHNSKFWKHAAPSFVNFDICSPGKSGKPQCIRALWESAVYASYGHVEVLQELTGTGPKQLMFCGGASKGFLWPQILADVIGVPVRVPVVKEATAFGCAMCVGLGAGLCKTFAEIVERWVKVEKEFHPNEDAHFEYQKHYERWRKVYAEFMKIVNQGLLTPMWRAPGT